jgi:hypothetical protein
MTMADTPTMSHADPGHVGPADPHVSGVHGTADDGGHGLADAEPLGPIDLRGWAYALIGGGLGVVVLVVLYLAAS